MNEKIKNYLGITGTFALTALTILLVVGIYATYTLSKGSNPTEYRSFSVSASGKINTTPDIAKLNISVITEGGKDIDKLQKENSLKIKKIVAFIKEQKIDDKDIQTTNYNLTPRYTNYQCSFRNTDPCPSSEISGYTVRTNIKINVRDFEKLGVIISGATENGANTISGPNFSIENPEKANSEARSKAIEKANKKAKEMARSGGFRLGKLLSIQEGGGYYPAIMRSDSFSTNSLRVSKESLPVIEPGSQDVTVNITLRYSIK